MYDPVWRFLLFLCVGDLDTRKTRYLIIPTLPKRLKHLPRLHECYAVGFQILAGGEVARCLHFQGLTSALSLRPRFLALRLRASVRHSRTPISGFVYEVTNRIQRRSEIYRPTCPGRGVGTSRSLTGSQADSSRACATQAPLSNTLSMLASE